MNITAIHLVRTGNHVLVKAEIDGRFITVIKEHADGVFSHIVEEGGMQRVNDAVCEIEGLIASNAA
jgi:hypothetical protein